LEGNKKMADVLIVNAKTGERVERDFTPEELAQREADAAAEAERVAAEQAAVDAAAAAKASAMEKLAALGLSESEVAAIVGA